MAVSLERVVIFFDPSQGGRTIGDGRTIREGRPIRINTVLLGL